MSKVPSTPPREEKKCQCGAMCVPGTKWCFVCNPEYPADAREEYFRGLPIPLGTYESQEDK